jgi:hypothetical protein
LILILFGHYKLFIQKKGCGNQSREKFWTNPKYLVIVSCPVDSKMPLIVSLTQTDQIRRRIESDGSYESSNEPIAFHLFRILDEAFLDEFHSRQQNKPDLYEFNDDLTVKVASTGIYLYERDINKLCVLDSGCYIIVPSTFDADVTMNFLLRISFEEKFLDMHDHKVEIYDLSKKLEDRVKIAKSSSDLNSSGLSSSVSSTSASLIEKDSQTFESREQQKLARPNKSVQLRPGVKLPSRSSSVCTIL